jgi:hypothetical protein
MQPSLLLLCEFSRTTANTNESRTNNANDQNPVITFGPLSVQLGLHTQSSGSVDILTTLFLISSQLSSLLMDTSK